MTFPSFVYCQIWVPDVTWHLRFRFWMHNHRILCHLALFESEFLAFSMIPAVMWKFVMLCAVFGPGLRAVILLHESELTVTVHGPKREMQNEFSTWKTFHKSHRKRNAATKHIYYSCVALSWTGTTTKSNTNKLPIATTQQTFLPSTWNGERTIETSPRPSEERWALGSDNVVALPAFMLRKKNE